MRKSLSIIAPCIVLTLFGQAARAQDLHWAKPIEGKSTITTALVVDGQGDLVFACMHGDSTDVDPGPGVDLRHGNYEFALVKTDPLGNKIWARSIGDGGTSTSQIEDIEVDNAGNIYVAGSFNGYCTWEGINNTVSDSSRYFQMEAYMAKYSPAGELLMLRKWGAATSSSYVSGLALALASNGDIYVAGAVKGSCDFDPGPGIALGTSSTLTYLQHLDANGNYVRMSTPQGTGSAGIGSLEIDLQDRPILSGTFNGTIDFDPGAGTASVTYSPVSFNAYNHFLWRLNPDGSFSKMVRFTGHTSSEHLSMEIDALGQTVLCGHFENYIDADPGAGTTTWNTPQDARESFVARLDTGLNLVWAARLAADTLAHARALDLDAQGNAYVTGIFRGNMDIDPGPGVAMRSSPVIGSTFIVKLGPAGQLLWSGVVQTVTPPPGVPFSPPRSVAAGNNGEFYLGGARHNFYDFDTGPGQYIMPPNNNIPSAFLARWYTCNPGTSVSTEQVGACDSYTWPLNGATYTQTGTYTAMPPNTASCDSLATLQLTIWGLNDTTKITVCDGNAYMWPVTGLSYTLGGTYQVADTTIQGCDSIHTLVLTQTGLGAGLIQTGSTLLAQPAGVSYQWLLCNPAPQPIPGATAQSFTPGANGDYAVIVSMPGIGCVDTSACFSFVLNGVPDPSTSIRAYPNPSAGTLHVDFGATLDAAQLSLLDLTGRVLLEQSVAGQESATLELPVAAGCYLLRVRHAGGQELIRVMRR